jgi:hypothetical protein
MYCKKETKLIIHISPYTFLAGYQYHAAKEVIHNQVGLTDSIIETYSGKDIQIGKIPEHFKDSKSLPALLFLNLDAAFNLFTPYRHFMESWVDESGLDQIFIDEVHTVLSEIRFRSSLILSSLIL